MTGLKLATSTRRQSETFHNIFIENTLLWHLMNNQIKKISTLKRTLAADWTCPVVPGHLDYSLQTSCLPSWHIQLQSIITISFTMFINMSWWQANVRIHLVHLYILNAVRCLYVRTSVTSGVASSVANDVIMRMGAASSVGARTARDARMTS